MGQKPRCALIAALLLLVASCVGGPTIRARGELDGEVRSNTQAVVIVGHADLIVWVPFSGGGVVYVPVKIERGAAWGWDLTSGESWSGPASDAPPWVRALYAPGELEELAEGLTEPLPEV